MVEVTWKEHRSFSVAWFFFAMVATSILYIFLIRSFGALPVARENRENIMRLEAKVDSLALNMRRELRQHE